MDIHRVLMYSAFGVAVICAGCASNSPSSQPDAAVREILAPSGKLRVALYPGTPTSIVTDAGDANPRGVGYDLGRALAQRLGVPFEPVVLPNNAEVLAAVKAGRVDFAFTNATAERMRDMDFSPICLEIELGYLVRPGSPVAALAGVDRPGVRIGVTANSSTGAKLTHDLTQATVIPAANIKAGAAMLAAGEIDAYATNKPTLYEMGDHLPGSRVLDGRWGEERMALAMPKGRDAGMAYLRSFVETAKADGLVSAAIARAGLRGAIEAR
jgi:polar amino acid transport system substrate-binding protein